MGRETKDKKFPLNFSAADSERRIKCPRAAPARFRSSAPCGELSRRALLTGRCRGNFSSETVAPFRREKTHRRIQDRHAETRDLQFWHQFDHGGKCRRLADAATSGKIRALKGNT